MIHTKLSKQELPQNEYRPRIIQSVGQIFQDNTTKNLVLFSRIQEHEF